ncbi:hypothetical protein [Sulfitobacter sp. JB4-11]|uniref:hypothetical protein n=1 Tax=Sulfitobacter rhodophyticola TaxID=3238304 RepID=UPI00351622EB
MRRVSGQMYVKERSPDRLRLTYVKWFPGVAVGLVAVVLVLAAVTLFRSGGVLPGLGALTCAAASAATCGITLRQVTVVLDATLGIVHVHNGPIRRRSVRSAPLAMLQGAEVETDPESTIAAKRLLLRFEDRPPWSVTQRSFVGDGPRRTATVVNTWLASHGSRPEDGP